MLASIEPCQNRVSCFYVNSLHKIKGCKLLTICLYPILGGQMLWSIVHLIR